jgi:hypothetical protein
MKDRYLSILVLFIVCVIAVIFFLIQYYVETNICLGTIITDQEVNFLGPLQYTASHGLYSICISNSSEGTYHVDEMYVPSSTTIYVETLLLDSKPDFRNYSIN